MAAESAGGRLLDGLDDGERQRLHEFCAAAKPDNLDAAIAALKSSGWDVQRALQQTRGPERGSGGRAPRDARGGRAAQAQAQFSLGPLFAWPFVLALRMALGAVHVLLSALGLRRITAAGIPGGTAAAGSEEARFARYFDEAFGPRRPPFFAGAYGEARDAAFRERRYLVVVLWSREHDDAEPMGQVLAHPAVVDYLSQPRFLVWAGDVAAPGAYQASLGLDVAAFPALGVFGVAPRAAIPTVFGPRARITLRRLAKLDGLPTADELRAAEAPPRSAGAGHDYIDCLARMLIRLVDGPVARHSAVASAARRSEQDRAVEQRLREQQDAAYEASLARDRQRDQEARARAEAERAEREEAERRQREQQRNEELRRQWRWAALARIVRDERQQQQQQAASSGAGGMARLSLRLESGQRIVRAFPAEATVRQVLDFVETREAAAEWDRTGATPFGRDLLAVEPPADYEHRYEFSLVSHLPRVVFDDRDATLRDALSASGLWPSAALIVEPLFEPEGSSSDNDGSG
ncbi:Ubx domain-containing protein [Coemansia javaensis]|uniref:Ubx domain-containing protein n=1 Tax=Coemansia javaensis TaxID=2761396 RepID=A0A9W8HF27_9FUNG|nr:Ubx domain-containing protein [Coemansia javaensis]